MKELENHDLKSPQSKEAQTALYACYFALQTALLTVDRPQAYYHALQSFYAAYDSYIAVVTAEMKPTCSAACGACCYDNPHGVTGAELLYIYDLIKDDPRFSEWQEAFAERYQLFQRLRQEKGKENIQIQWKKTHRSCVFLGADQRCNIYERRPVACRMFFSLTSPALCMPNHPQHDSAVNPHLEPSTAIKDALKQLSVEQSVADVPKDFISGMHQLIKKMDQKNHS